MRPGDKDAALRAELAELAAAAKSGEAFAREPPPAPPAPPAPIDKPAVPPSPPENKGSDFAGTTIAVVKPNLYDHGHTFGEFKIFAAINTASVRWPGVIFAGTVVVRKIPSSCTFSPGS